MDKEEFRNRIRLKKIELFGGEPEHYRNASSAVCRRVINWKFFIKSDNIALFSSKKSSFEVITDEIFRAAHDSGKMIHFPKCDIKRRNLVFAPISDPESELELGHFSIMEPKESLIPENQRELTEKFDLVLVPGLAFDVFGNRMGYGTGYYDNFLAEFRRLNSTALVIGLCFDFQIFPSPIPHTPRDAKIDGIISQNHTIIFPHFRKNKPEISF